MRERAVRLVLEQQAAHGSQWQAIRSIAGKMGCTAESLRRWLRHAERDAGRRPGLPTTEQQRLKELERENRELRRANEILRKASAFFAQAELDRRGSTHVTSCPEDPGRFKYGVTEKRDSPSCFARIALHWTVRASRHGT